MPSLPSTDRKHNNPIAGDNELRLQWVGIRIRDNWLDLYPGVAHEAEITLDRDCTLTQLRRIMSVMSWAQSY